MKHTKNHLPHRSAEAPANPELPHVTIESHRPHQSPDSLPLEVLEKPKEHYESRTQEAQRLAATEEQHRSEQAPKPPAKTRREPVDIDEEFAHTLVAIQQEMPPTQRTFSRFIHNKPVEVASDFLSATVVRPNAMLAGSISAFILMLAIYLFTKSVGYVLSGFELIAAFAIGWILGMIYDYIHAMTTSSR